MSEGEGAFIPNREGLWHETVQQKKTLGNGLQAESFPKQEGA